MSCRARATTTPFLGRMEDTATRGQPSWPAATATASLCSRKSSSSVASTTASKRWISSSVKPPSCAPFPTLESRGGLTIFSLKLLALPPDSHWLWNMSQGQLCMKSPAAEAWTRRKRCGGFARSLKFWRIYTTALPRSCTGMSAPEISF